MKAATLTSPTSDLESEIEQLRDDLRKAEDSRITPADRRVIELRQQLLEREHELQAQQEAESAAVEEQRHQQQLAALHEIENDIDHAKTETLTLRRLLAELPAKLSAAEYRLNQLLRSHAQLKTELGNTVPLPKPGTRYDHPSPD